MTSVKDRKKIGISDKKNRKKKLDGHINLIPQDGGNKRREAFLGEEGIKMKEKVRLWLEKTKDIAKESDKPCIECGRTDQVFPVMVGDIDIGKDFMVSYCLTHHPLLSHLALTTWSEMSFQERVKFWVIMDENYHLLRTVLSDHSFDYRAKSGELLKEYAKGSRVSPDMVIASGIRMGHRARAIIRLGGRAKVVTGKDKKYVLEKVEESGAEFVKWQKMYADWDEVKEYQK